MRSLSSKFVKNGYHLQGVTECCYSTHKDTKYMRGVQDIQSAEIVHKDQVNGHSQSIRRSPLR